MTQVEGTIWKTQLIEDWSIQKAHVVQKHHEVRKKWPLRIGDKKVKLLKKKHTKFLILFVLDLRYIVHVYFLHGRCAFLQLQYWELLGVINAEDLP